MANAFYTTVGGLRRNAIMLSEEPETPNDMRVAEVIFPDENGVYAVLDSDAKKTAKAALMAAYKELRKDVLGPFETMEAALEAQEESEGSS